MILRCSGYHFTLLRQKTSNNQNLSVSYLISITMRITITITITMIPWYIVFDIIFSSISYFWISSYGMSNRYSKIMSRRIFQLMVYSTNSSTSYKIIRTIIIIIIITFLLFFFCFWCVCMYVQRINHLI